MKTKFKLNLTISVIFVVLIIAGLVYVSLNNLKGGKENNNLTNDLQQNNLNTNDVIGGSYNGITTIENKQNDTICYDSPKYFIITHPSGEVDDDYLIKYKTNENQTIYCNYSPEKNDFEIKKAANNFVTIENNFLVAQSSTMPYGENLYVYDLINRKKIYFDGSTEIKSIKDNTITYWGGSTDKILTATEEKCPDFFKNYPYPDTLPEGYYQMEPLISINLIDLTKKELGEYRCPGSY